MRSKRLVAAALVLFGVASFAVLASPANAGNALCPNLCLTGGLPGRSGSSASASVSGVEDLKGQAGSVRNTRAEGMEVISFSRTWSGVDLSANPGVFNGTISVVVAGNNGTNYKGYAVLDVDGVGSATIPVNLTNVLGVYTLQNRGGDDTFIMFDGVVASFVSPDDELGNPDKDCDEADDHDSNGGNTGIGHIINACNGGHGG